MSFVLQEKILSGVRVSLNRADVRNAFHPDMIAELTAVARQLARDESVRFVLLEGKGSAFCAGADLQWMKSMAQYTEAENEADALQLDGMFQALADLPQPLVVYSHGFVFGGALGLLGVSDFSISDQKTILCFSEVKLGLVPAVISPYVLRRSSAPRLAQLMLTGQRFDEEVAQSVGLVDYILTPEEKEAWLVELTKDLNEGGPRAVAETKKLLNQLRNIKDRQKVKTLTTQTIAKVRVSEEGQDGLSAFFEKRNPPWRKA